MSSKTKAVRKTVKRRTNIERPRNGGEWSESRFRSFIYSALRRAQWPPKFQCIRDAFVKHGINPETGRKCKLCRCSSCQNLFPQGKLRADHILPCVGPEGFIDWNTFIARIYVEANGFQALCDACHHIKSQEERAARSLPLPAAQEALESPLHHPHPQSLSEALQFTLQA